jgi:uncharacterized membrane protein
MMLDLPWAEQRVSRRTRRILVGCLMAYSAARVSVLFADHLPSLLIVLLHVAPPALFAVIHGAVQFRAKGIAVFISCCLGIGTISESLSLRTGFPFGHYYFTDVMGPKIAGLPLLLVLAYLGIGYISWVIASLLLGRAGRYLEGWSVFLLPVLASVIMTSWDLAMDPVWSTMDRAWVWRDGGSYFGVPATNFIGWAANAYVGYQIFALYWNRYGVATQGLARNHWRSAIGMYGVCAVGNLLIPLKTMAPAYVMDGAGRQWQTSRLLLACASVSVGLMGSFAVVAWFREGSLELRRRPEQASPKGARHL